MITDIELVNLQSHAKTKLTFVPGVNIITGPSDVGKSAVLRGIEWWALNRPPGDVLRRHGTKVTFVEGQGVKKVRSASSHRYEINGKKLKALRTDVPQEVQDTLRLSEVNFQGQHSAYFLIADSPGQVAKTLNKVADLEIIDLSLKAARHRVREAKGELKYQEQQLTETSEKIEDLQWVLEADNDLQEIEVLLKKAEEIDTEELQGIIDECERLNSEVDAFPEIIPDLSEVDNTLSGLVSVDLSLGDVIQSIEENQLGIPDPSRDIQAVEDVLHKLTTLEDDGLGELITTCEKSLMEASSIPDPSRDIQVVDDYLTKLEEVTTAEEEITKLVEEYETAFDDAHWAYEQYNAELKEYQLLLEEIGICPLCEGSLV